MIAYEEFTEKAKEVARKGDGGEAWRVEGLDEHFLAAWVAGGITGGDCWGGNASDSLSPEPEAHLEGLVEILEQEDVLLRHANAILKLVEKGEKTFVGYYENSETIAWKYIPFEAVYDKLVEFGYALPKVEHAP